MILLTMRGAIKFNMWKRTEGGKMIASALIEMDYKMVLQVKENIILYYFIVKNNISNDCRKKII